MSITLTPMMRQYLSIKEKNKGSILFFRMGDFYEMFFEDAKLASRILQITLTSRSSGKDNKVPMCGIPFHAADNYIARLIRNGQRVAICEQVEEPSPETKLVKREVVKVITPGTFIADEILEESVNNYILSIYSKDDKIGLAYADISTGEFRLTEVTDLEDFFAELYKISPTECLVPETLFGEKRFNELKTVNLGVITTCEDWLYDHAFSVDEIKRHFKVKELSGFGCEEMECGVSAAGALIKYLKDTQRSALDNIGSISTYRLNQYMTLDWNSHRNLELIHSMEDYSKKGTLLEVLDRTKTPMGKRRLKQYILNPLIDVETINERLDAVNNFVDDQTLRDKVRSCLDNIYDVDRLSNKVSLGTANPRDMEVLSSSLKHISEFKELLLDVCAQKLKVIVSGIEDFNDIISMIDSTICDNPPVAVKDGSIIRTGRDETIDELRNIISHGKDWIVALQKKEIERTGINSLKVRFNKVFGYYIEVTKTNLNMVPDDYFRKQTLVNAERFVTEELKEYESKILGAEDKIKTREYDLFCELRSKVALENDRLKKISDQIAELDVLSDLAEVASKNGYARPHVSDDNVLSIVDGRHPVLEGLLKGKEFIPNDTSIGGDRGKMFIITGSNMAGKSTYIRQVALITIMAQMGGFVPAREATIGVVDRVFTRVGASDRLYRGMSTFMVEMLETANILNNATDRSLIILDEIGRGTSTYDGVSIAWAAVEHICGSIPGAKTLFATHFHELTELSTMITGVKNYHLEIREWKGEVIFLYKVVEGSCDESFGIHVAKLAGMPPKVVSRAREILHNLQNDSLAGTVRTRFKDDKPREIQFDLFEGKVVEEPISDELRGIDINKMTPLDALKKLEELKKLAEGSE